MLRKLGRIPDERSCFSPFASLYTDQASCPLSDAARTRTPKRVFPVTLPIGNLHRRGSDPALQSGPLHSSATQPKFHRESSIPPRNVSRMQETELCSHGPSRLNWDSLGYKVAATHRLFRADFSRHRGNNRIWHFGGLRYRAIDIPTCRGNRDISRSAVDGSLRADLPQLGGHGESHNPKR